MRQTMGQGSPVTRFVARLEQARALGEDGKHGLAAALTGTALEESEAVPEPWLDMAQELRSYYLAPSASLAPPAGLAEEVGLDEAAPPGARPGLYVEVNRAAFTLRIFRDRREVAAFPVGLGKDNSTPAGEFHVANKVTDPDWNNRGELVKAGDPRNLLGKRWMGLAGPRGKTPYGIHPTNEPESIGGSMSRGCIRMRPADAETLFSLCAVGTPVLIE